MVTQNAWVQPTSSAELSKQEDSPDLPEATNRHRVGRKYVPGTKRDADGNITSKADRNDATSVDCNVHHRGTKRSSVSQRTNRSQFAGKYFPGSRRPNKPVRARKSTSRKTPRIIVGEVDERPVRRSVSVANRNDEFTPEEIQAGLAAVEVTAYDYDCETYKQLQAIDLRADAESLGMM